MTQEEFKARWEQGERYSKYAQSLSDAIEQERDIDMYDFFEWYDTYNPNPDLLKSVLYGLSAHCYKITIAPEGGRDIWEGIQ